MLNSKFNNGDWICVNEKRLRHKIGKIRSYRIIGNSETGFSYVYLVYFPQRGQCEDVGEKNNIELIDVNKYFEHRWQVKTGHIIMHNHEKKIKHCIVENAEWKTHGLCVKMGEVYEHSIWTLRCRELNPDGRYNPVNDLLIIEQNGEEIDIIGEMKLEVNFR